VGGRDGFLASTSATGLWEGLHTGEGFLAWKSFFWNGLKGTAQELSNEGEDGVPEVLLGGDQRARVEEAGEPECADRGAHFVGDNLTGFSSICVFFFMSPPKARASSGDFLVVIGEAPKNSGLRCRLWDFSSGGEGLLIELEGLEDL